MLTRLGEWGSIGGPCERCGAQDGGASEPSVLLWLDVH